jgi:hypothetical protein
LRARLRFLWLFIDPFLFAAGLACYALTKRTPLAAAGSLRRLYVATDGRVNDASGRVSSILHPPVPLGRVSGVLGDLDPRDVDRIANDIHRHGYHLFGARLGSDVCERIVDFAKSSPATLIPAPVGGPSEAIYDPASPLATRYDLAESRIFELAELQQLATDVTLMAVAQAYLGCRPVNDLVAMWWSAAHGGGPSSEAAQLFHFDMDRLKFLKFFVYLSDVDADRGPHVYVDASHARKPKAIRRDGRIPDDEIIGHYGADAILELTGDRGTILAVDTRGFHKGKALETGDRLLFQVEYANSLFGVPYNRIAVSTKWSERALAQIRRHRSIFGRFDVGQ